MMNVPLPLAPLPYHLEMVDYLQAHESDLWKWFSADRLRAEHNETVRMDLLKSTYRIEPDANPALYAAAREVSDGMGLVAPLTLYQSAVTGGMNMGLAYVPGEAHLILTGPVADTLAHARLFFDDFKPLPGMDVLEPDELPGGDEKVRDYYCYVLLDFAVADGDLEDAPSRRPCSWRTASDSRRGSAPWRSRS